jgi:hypothetical protein
VQTTDPALSDIREEIAGGAKAIETEGRRAAHGMTEEG